MSHAAPLAAPHPRRNVRVRAYYRSLVEPPPRRAVEGRMQAARGAVAAAGLAAMLFADVARADTLSSVRSDLVVETAHSVEIVVHRRHLSLEVTRTVHNGGDRADQATFVLDVPEGAVATGLRTLGALRGEPHWWAADLYEAELAARLYRELTGFGGYTPKDPALLSWRAQRTLVLQVFPIAKDDDKTIAYALELPLAWRDGADRRTLDPMGLPGGAAVHAHIRAARADDVVFVDGSKTAPTDDVTLDHAVDIVLQRGAPPPLDASLAIAGAGKRALVHLAIDAAPRLSTAPIGARVVVVLDVSRSMHGRVAPAVAAARAYLEHMPDARVEIVTFARRADRLLGGFSSVATANEALLAAGAIRQNGSNLDLALAEADALLATAPDGAARRMVVLTDRETRSSLDEARVRAALRKSGALVHLAIPDVGEPSLTEATDALTSAVVRATGGVVWHARASNERPFALAMRRTYEEWARPLRLQDVVVHIGESEHAPVGATLEEGQSLEATWVADTRPSTVTLEGRFWAEPVRRALVADEAGGRLWSALVFGTGAAGTLEPGEMMELARRGGAVSPVTSYLAVEPGVRPSTEGFVGHGRLGGSHRSRAPQIRMGSASVSDRFDHVSFLREKLLDGLRGCGSGATVALAIETTHDEIVEVTPTSSRAELAACMEEVAWAIELPAEFRDVHRVFSISL